MRQDWETKKLGDVLVKTEMIDPTKMPEKEFIYLDVSSVNKERKEIESASILLGKDAPSRARKLVRTNDVIFATVRPTHGRVALITEDYEGQVCSTGYFVLRGKENIDNKYLFYFLLTDEFNQQMEKLQKGASYPAVTDAEVKSILLRYPKQLPEQRRIVSILDQCFAAIDKAKANAEQNLKNAKELFESYLQGVFEKKGDGWEERRLEDCFKLKSGDNLTAKNMSNGKYPVFGGNGVAGYHHEFNLSGSNVIIGRVGALCGNVRHITENIWLTDNAFKVVDFQYEFDHSFLAYLLNYKNLRSYARQAAQPVISNTSLKDLVLTFPKSRKSQENIVHKLDTLRAEITKLKNTYKKKNTDLEMLKKSILNKAFTGQL